MHGAQVWCNVKISVYSCIYVFVFLCVLSSQGSYFFLWHFTSVKFFQVLTKLSTLTCRPTKSKSLFSFVQACSILIAWIWASAYIISKQYRHAAGVYTIPAWRHWGNSLNKCKAVKVNLNPYIKKCRSVPYSHMGATNTFSQKNDLIQATICWHSHLKVGQETNIKPQNEKT